MRLLYSLWADWITATGNPGKPDEIYNPMLDAADCIQCTNFNLLHGYYRAALAELRGALELVMIGTFGSLNPTDKDYIVWKKGEGELSFTRCRRRLSGTLTKNDAKWMLEDGGLLAATYQKLCNLHSLTPGRE